MFKKKNTLLMITTVLVTGLMFTGCKGESTIKSGESETDTTVSTEALEDVVIRNFDMPEAGEKIAVITVKDYGEIKIKLFSDVSAKGTENFIGLAEMEYYDELIFHRIIPDFMIQGGDPRGDGTGGKSIWGEKFEGGIAEGLYHFSGAVAYANSQGTSTNGSQFYIVNTLEGSPYLGGSYNEDGSIHYNTTFSEAGINLPGNVEDIYMEKGGAPSLDGGYTVFGQVFEGLDIVREISTVETNEDDKPLKQVQMESVKIVEYQPE